MGGGKRLNVEEQKGHCSLRTLVALHQVAMAWNPSGVMQTLNGELVNACAQALQRLLTVRPSAQQGGQTSGWRHKHQRAGSAPTTHSGATRLQSRQARASIQLLTPRSRGPDSVFCFAARHTSGAGLLPGAHVH